ncbi:MAG TPA: hypothetical protein HPP77_06835 [Candidatus Hydrogenedentes bacterium]|nr:hypothetical protein [Candidatus Hydrogenedentota bacterium]HIJ72868.1 hypothetical protein [Candidatus Hydrogenedentota bacterium]
MATAKEVRDWEKRFPDLDDTWTYWWLEGDGAVLAVFHGGKLLEALEFIKANHEKCKSIIAYRASRNSEGQLVQDKSRGWEVYHDWAHRT